MTSKEKLINATIDTIYYEGLNGVTTAKIAKAAGLSEAMIYKTFGNKDKMIVGSFMFIKTELNRYVLSKMSDSADYITQCRNIWYANLDFLVGNKKYLRVISQFEHSSYMTLEVRDECFNLIAAVFEFFKKGISNNFFKNMHYEIAVALFFAPILSIAESIVDKRISRTDENLEIIYNSTMDAMRLG